MGEPSLRTKIHKIKETIADHQFVTLFVEDLGWDRFRSAEPAFFSPTELTPRVIAQKRGFLVFACEMHRTDLANRSLLCRHQRELRKQYHEHILIHYCKTPRKQVWQWVTSVDDGRRVLHREHPFFSHDPPPHLLERLKGLAIPIEQEEQTTLVDVLDRVRAALMPDSELNLFARKPWYAKQSDRLAMDLKAGKQGAFGEFVEFHLPLARKASRMLVRWFGMAVELETAEISAEQWDNFCNAQHLDCFSDVPHSERPNLIDHHDVPDSDEAAITVEFQNAVHAAIETLKPRQQLILKMRYGIGDQPHTLKQIGEHLGITRERVRQIQSKAEEKLATQLRALGFEPLPPRIDKPKQEDPEPVEAI